MQAHEYKLLKKDAFGRISLVSDGNGLCILRDATGTKIWLRPVARWLIRREARALAVLDHLEGTPCLLDATASSLRRSFIEGDVMQSARPDDGAYFRSAAQLLRRMHRQCVVHNDLAKEPNWLVTPAGEPESIVTSILSIMIVKE